MHQCSVDSLGFIVSLVLFLGACFNVSVSVGWHWVQHPACTSCSNARVLPRESSLIWVNSGKVGS